MHSTFILPPRFAQGIKEVVEVFLVMVLAWAVPIWLPVLEPGAGKYRNIAFCDSEEFL